MIVSPADFPQVWEKPTYEVLLACLKRLQVDPPIWNPSTSRRVVLNDHENSAQFRREVASYLGTIIKSGLLWIDDDDEKEAIWEEASKRLSERCGRAGMGEITRRWPFQSESYPDFDLIIREPAITGDSLGLKTWGSSYVFAQLLHGIADESLSHLLSATGPPVSVLELGSGTGLLGMAAAAIWRTQVYLSDLPTIVPNLSYNVDKNRGNIEALGGQVQSGALTWGGGEDDHELFTKNQFQIVLAADSLYDDVHSGLLASAIKDYLMNDDNSRAAVMIPLRDAMTKRLLSDFRSSMEQGDRALKCLEERTVAGQDDWGEDGDEVEVECWWGVFG